MKKKFMFSESKFSSFSNKKKLQVIVSIIDQIPKEWNSDQIRTRLLNTLNTCLRTLEDNFSPDIIDFKYIAYHLHKVKTSAEFLFLTKNIWHKYGNKIDDTDLPLSLCSRNDRSSSNLLPLNIVLENLRSAFNVGSIIRTSECFGINKLYFCGYTPTPDNLKVKKTAMGTSQLVNWEQWSETTMLLKKLKHNTTVIALETGKNVINTINHTAIPQPATLILGNEALGINDDTLALADLIIEIPVFGWKKSLNVATAYGIACYEIFRQWTS